jgi:hypothetical protein
MRDVVANDFTTAATQAPVQRFGTLAKGEPIMPRTKIHALEGQCDGARMDGVSVAFYEALINVLKVAPDDFFHIIHVIPLTRLRHTPSFLGLKYSDDLIVLELTFVSSRPKDTRLALAQGAERADHRPRRHVTRQSHDPAL